MSRTLTAGARTPRGESPAAMVKKENQDLAYLYGCLCDIYLLADRRRRLITANARLEPKLNDPTLQHHPKHPEYAALFHARDLEIRVLELRAEPLQREFALIWPRLSEERRERFRAEEVGWPDVTIPALLAKRIWEWFQMNDFLWPGGSEAPFGILVVFVAIASLRA